MSRSITIAWRTEIMPAPAFAMYHNDCYHGQEDNLPETEALWGNIGPVSLTARCKECGDSIHNEAGAEQKGGER